MSPSAKQDSVAVIGGGIGGLSAAGLLCKRGRHVVLFEQRERLGGKAERLQVDGLSFDTGPTLLALPHLLASVFEDLHIEMPRLHRLERQCEYLYPNGQSFSAYESLEQTAQQAELLGTGEGFRLAQFYKRAEDIFHAAGAPFLDAPFDGFTGFIQQVWRSGGAKAALLGASLGTLNQLAEQTVSSPELRQFINRFATYVGASPYEASASFALIAHAERAFGVHHPEGGMGALATRLAHGVQHMGVEMRLGERVTYRHTGKDFAVTSSAGEERFSQVIVNVDPWSSLDQAQSPSPLHRDQLSMSGYVMLLDVPKVMQLAHHSILFSADYEKEFAQIFAGEIPDDPTIYLCHAAASDPTVQHESRTALYVMVNSPTWDPDSPYPSVQLRERLLARLRSLIGSGAKVVGERTPHDFAALGAPRGSLYGAVGHGRMGPFSRPRMRGKYAGQFFVGGGTHPGGGVPMVALSGRFAAELAMTERARKPASTRAPWVRR